MEITLEQLKRIIGDQTCRIALLEEDKRNLITGYNKLLEENKRLKLPKKTKKAK